MINPVLLTLGELIELLKKQDQSSPLVAGRRLTVRKQLGAECFREVDVDIHSWRDVTKPAQPRESTWLDADRPATRRIDPQSSSTPTIHDIVLESRTRRAAEVCTYCCTQGKPDFITQLGILNHHDYLYGGGRYHECAAADIWKQPLPRVAPGDDEIVSAIISACLSK